MTILDLVRTSLQKEEKTPQDNTELLQQLLEKEYREYVRSLQKGEEKQPLVERAS